MNTVEFHHGMADKLAYACRLVRKAYRHGAQVVVLGEATALKALDRQLWVFDEQEFLPHVLTTAEQDVPLHLQDSPVWLMSHQAQSDAPPKVGGVLVNMGPDMPAHPQRYARLFEIVSTEPHDRLQGRQRWKRYEALGLTIEPHEVAA